MATTITKGELSKLVTKEDFVSTSVFNQCNICLRKPGRYFDSVSSGMITVWLLADARGFDVCNICAGNGKLVKKRKITKAEKKHMKRMRMEMSKIKDIKHITLDAQGKEVK